MTKSNDQVWVKNQQVQDKSEKIEKCLDSETGLEYYSSKVK